LEQGRYAVRRAGGELRRGVRARSPRPHAALVALADPVYDRVTQRVPDRQDDHAERVSDQFWKVVPNHERKTIIRTLDL